MDPVNVQATVEVRSFTKTWVTPWIRPSGSPNVTDFGTNRKRVYEFLITRKPCYRKGDRAMRPITYRVL